MAKGEITYTEDVVVKLKEYLDGTKWTLYPNILDFCCLNPDVERRSLYRWEEAKDKDGEYLYPSLRLMLRRIRENSLNQLKNGGLTKEFDSRTVALVASKDHDYREVKETDNKTTLKLEDASDDKLAEILNS